MTRRELRRLMGELGKRTSARKAEAARANGAKGGHPSLFKKKKKTA